MQDNLGLAEAPEVDLTSDPAPNVFRGRFEEGRVTFPGPVGEVAVDLKPFDLEVLGSLVSGRVRSEGPLSGELRAELTEEDVAGLAASSATAPVRGVELEEGKVVVGSEVAVLGINVPVGAEGTLSLRDGVLSFEPDRVRALGQPVPDGLADRLLADANFSYPVDGLPGGGEVSGVEVHKDRIFLTGDVALPGA